MINNLHDDDLVGREHGEAGTALIRFTTAQDVMEIPADRPENIQISDVSCSIDDASESIASAMNSEFSRSRVIDLPLPVRVTIYVPGCGDSGSMSCVFERRSRVPGNVDFQLSSGSSSRSEFLMPAFLDNRWFDRAMVRDIRGD